MSETSVSANEPSPETVIAHETSIELETPLLVEKETSTSSSASNELPATSPAPFPLVPALLRDLNHYHKS